MESKRYALWLAKSKKLNNNTQKNTATEIRNNPLPHSDSGRQGLYEEREEKREGKKREDKET
jgi:hypothetical protein